MNERKELNKGLSSGWRDDEKRLIAAVAYPMFEMQKAYGRDLDAKLVMRGWEMALSDQFTGEQIAAALKAYMLKGRDFPTPKDIADIIKPPRPAITEAQYIQACKAQERNGYPAFSYEDQIIREYKGQNGAQESGRQLIENGCVSGLIEASVKRTV